MTTRYDSMIYSAIATLHFYRKDIVPIGDEETCGDFVNKNKPVVERVHAEVLSLFNYDLSDTQMGRAILAYLSPSNSISNPIAKRE